jgi:hypothetical protein
VGEGDDSESDIVKSRMKSIQTSLLTIYTPVHVHAQFPPHDHKENPASLESIFELDPPISLLESTAEQLELFGNSRNYWKTSRIGMKIGSLSISLYMIYGGSTYTKEEEQKGLKGDDPQLAQMDFDDPISRGIYQLRSFRSFRFRRGLG